MICFQRKDGRIQRGNHKMLIEKTTGNIIVKRQGQNDQQWSTKYYLSEYK